MATVGTSSESERDVDDLLTELEHALETRRYVREQQRQIERFWADGLRDPSCPGHEELEGLHRMDRETMDVLEDTIHQLMDLGVLQRPAEE